MDSTQFTIENNTCIISSNLLDELDYIVGGYGKPTIESLFNLNTFIEAYILSSYFIITKEELDHIKITSKVLFPNGRPIADLIVKSHRLYSVGGLGNRIMRCVYVNKTSKKDNETIENAISEFIIRDVEKIKSSLKISNLSSPVEDITTFSVGFGETQILIGETTNKPFEIVKSFFDSITNYNTQAALPLFTYKQQFNELRKKAISKDIYRTICEIQGQNIADAEKYLGGEIQLLPQFVSIVLSKAKNREDILTVLKGVRDDFTDFRLCCEKFEKNLNDSTTIKEQIEAIKEYKNFWAILVKKYTDKTSRILFRFIDVMKDSDYEDAADSAIDNQSVSEILNDLNLGKIAGKTGILAWEKIKEKRILNKFKGVTNLWSLIENSPNINSQIKDIERIFGSSIDRNKVNTARLYLKAIEKTSAQKVLPPNIEATNV